jgi:hypothetical protein
MRRDVTYVSPVETEWKHRTLRAFVGHGGHALVMVVNERPGGQREQEILLGADKTRRAG